MYPVRGAVTVSSERGRIVVTKFRAAVIGPWEKHRVSAEGNASLRSVFIEPGFLDEDFFAKPVRMITPLLHELIQEAGRNFDGGSTENIHSKVLELISRLLPNSQAEGGFVILPSVDHPRLARAFLDADDADLDGDLSASFIAQKAALSSRQFSRLFKETTGMTFQEWRTLLRVQRGIKLLSEGESVTQVATELGFSTSSAFIDTFRKRTGLTPKKFMQI